MKNAIFEGEKGIKWIPQKFCVCLFAMIILKELKQSIIMVMNWRDGDKEKKHTHSHPNNNPIQFHVLRVYLFFAGKSISNSRTSLFSFHSRRSFFLHLKSLVIENMRYVWASVKSFCSVWSFVAFCTPITIAIFNVNFATTKRTRRRMNLQYQHNLITIIIIILMISTIILIDELWLNATHCEWIWLLLAHASI